jgi:NAD(P)-dependent dehydrogenase (short-subunit alcohol dehydrogenase family)
MRRILVTGANKGIGFALVSEILRSEEDTFVFLSSRDSARGQAALRSLLKEHPEWSERAAFVQLDVTSDDSVKRAAETVAQICGEEPLYAVVNNAGIGLGAANLRAVMDVNILGVQRVCQAFLPLLDKTSGRVVNITSAAGPNFVSKCSPERQAFFLDSQIEWPALRAFIDECCELEGPAAFAERGLSDGDAYGLSKACGGSYTMLLARENPTLRINSCTPGYIATDMTRPYAERSGKSPEELGMKTPTEGTRSCLFLLFGEPEGNGRYYGSDARRSPLDRYRSPGDPPYEGP